MQILISTEKNKNLLEAEAQANKLILEQIASAQAKVLSTDIAKWREEELKKVEENPAAYIQSSTNSVSFSWKRALGISQFKQSISKQVGIPMTKQGMERKIGNLFISFIFRNK